MLATKKENDMIYQNVSSFEKHLESSFPDRISLLYFVIAKDDFERKKLVDGIVCYFYEKSRSSKIVFSASEISSYKVIDSLEVNLFQEKPIVVVDEVELFKKNDIQNLLFFLKNNILDGFLILGARSKKMILSLIMEFDKKGAVLDLTMEKRNDKENRFLSFIQKKCAQSKKQITDEAKRELLKNTFLDLALLEKEVEKTISYVGENTLIEKKDVLEIKSAVEQKTFWQIAEKIVWEEDPFCVDFEKNHVVDSNFFYSLTSVIRYQLEQGLSFFFEENHLFYKFLNKKKRAIFLGKDFFKKALLMLFEIELLSRKNTKCYIALLDSFRAKLKYLLKNEINNSSKPFI